ncbi:MAG: metallophosphoesterase [Nanoarchaeota archaeon]|nr:metallophosphoesterase [Nanoarchaeota archaeon]
MNEEILDLVKERGLLLEKDIFDLLNNFNNTALAKNFLESLEKVSGQKIITSTLLTKNFEYVQNIVNDLPGETKSSVEKIFVKMGLSLEIKKESEIKNHEHVISKQRYQIFYAESNDGKKIEVKDFVNHFRSRYQQLQKILVQREGLQNLTSINKIAGNRQRITIIGIVVEKRVTKNKNLIIKFEDLTGEINTLAKAGTECFAKAAELQLDDVVAVKASGNNDLLFIYDIVYPDAILLEKTKFKEDICIAFLSDVHAGSNKHLGKEFERFVQWLNSDNELAKKIKYLFFVGDNVDGIGVFPGQERTLDIINLKDQYDLLGSYLEKIPERITMFMCPGQHDSVRVAEPQPIIDNHYGAALHKIPNLVLVSNPAMVKFIEDDKEFKVLMYHGASIHSFINEIEELRLMKAHSCPAKVVRHMLKRRHLAPSHSSVVYVPGAEFDPLVISEVPNVMCTGEVHRTDIENYNGVLIITGSCWQSRTDFEEKIGNIPDPCKVPILNLKTSELKILDFSGGEE